MAAVPGPGSPLKGAAAAAGPEPPCQRINVLEIGSGVCLFDVVWDFRGTKHPQAISSLVKTFLMFAKDVDAGGELLSARFEDPPPERERRTMGGMMSIRRPAVPKQTDPTGMTCERRENVCVAVFHRMDAEVHIIRRFAAALAEDFHATYASELSGLRDTFVRLSATDNPDAAELEEIRGKFMGFEKQLAKLQADAEDADMEGHSGSSEAASEDSEIRAG